MAVVVGGDGFETLYGLVPILQTCIQIKESTVNLDGV